MKYLDIKRKRRLTFDAYREVFATEAGQRVMQDLMDSCFFYRPTKGDTPEETYFNEGARSVVLRLLQTLKVNPDTYRKQLDEQFNGGTHV